MITAILLVLGIAVLSHVAPFPFVLDAVSGQTAVWRIAEKAGRRAVYLTYDDGPNPTATPALLDLLEEKGVHATFFLIDEYVNENTAAIVRRMFEEGHTVGLHSNDRWLMMKSPDALADRLHQAADHVESLTGSRPSPLFRPHAGWRSLPMFQGVARRNYKLLGWSLMSWDWCWFRRRTGERVASQILSHAAPGNIIVIHDGHHRNPSADRCYAIEATRIIIDGLRSRGYEFGTLNKISVQP